MSSQPRITAIEARLAGAPFHVLRDADGSLCAAGFGPVGVSLAKLSGALAGARPAADPAPGDVLAALAALDAGDAEPLLAFPVRQPGTEFRQAVWAELRRVAPGAPLSYAALAARVGRPRAVRAVASACANNLVAVFVPCHRIVRSDGSLGGYLYGLPAKERLLALERGAGE